MKSLNSIKVISPATGKQVGTVTNLNIAQVKKIIQSAEKAFSSWSNKSAFERAGLVKNWHQLILKNKNAIAKTLSAESGKLLAESLIEVEYAATFVDWSAEEAKRVYGEIIPMPNANKGYVVKQPIGVVAAITPWNFPAAMITRKVAPALAAGCTVVCKPSSATPLTAIVLHKLAIQAGIPSDVFSIVTGDANLIGKELATNHAVKKLSFTGSTEIGKLLMAQCAGSVKKITMELGGNAPFIVFDDADIDLAVENAIKSRFRFSGQTCICANRFLVHEKIYKKFADKITAQAKKLEIAPLINKAAVAKVDKLIKSSGGKILCGGKFKGNYYSPTVISDLSPKSEIFSHEIFGPVVTLFKFKTEAEAISLANATPYGLAAYIFTGDSSRGLKVAEKIDFGMVGVNDIAINATHSPFGGMKESGIGREGSHYGLEEFLEIKFISVKQ